MNHSLSRTSLAVQSTLIFITALTIGAEIYEPLKSALTSLSGHHWLSKSILSLFFFGAALVGLKAMGYHGRRQPRPVSLTLVLCSLVLLLYFSWHYLEQS